MPAAKMKARPMPAHVAEKHDSQDLSSLAVPTLRVVAPQAPKLAKMKAHKRTDRKD